ncbi:methyltransferase domain-containing protein [Rhodobacterales bacterium HKCCSP123]|nr:methyltransferase domain-containing protein [Rhodobacterales bacterium HKCCSP123]
MQPDVRAKAPHLFGHSPRLTIGRPGHADWTAYATAYDLLSEHNPAYRELLSDFRAFLTSIKAPGLVYDIGGGTGNYAEIVARSFPESEIRFVEPDPGMVRVAQAKLATRGNIRFETRSLEDLSPAGTADLVICVHALYAMPNQQRRLADLRRLLRPGGLLYLVDLGREMNLSDWRRYLFTEISRKHGVRNAIRVFWRGRPIARANRAILEAQRHGIYWTHSGEEIATSVRAAGFEILRQLPVYRGYSDLLVCRAGQ